MTTFQSTELDFGNIKQSLKLSFQKKTEFLDYDFDASALNNLLDVLSLNTHYNMLGVNFGINETFLNSAQLRSSVVSIGNYLGYNIRSNTASQAKIRLSLNLTDVSPANRPTTIPLPIGTSFISNSDNVNYTFSTIKQHLAHSDSDGNYVFTLDGDEYITIYEGSIQTKTFLVGADVETFIIPDRNIDTKTARVLVYPTFNSFGDEVEYTDIFNAREFNSESTYYRIIETPLGEYELNFGDGITGQSPQPGNRIVLTYVSSSGSIVNSLSTFTPTSSIVIGNNSYDMAVTALTPSYGGQNKQSIESIRFNAPLAFAQQQRLVTATDYESSVRTNYNIKDVASWGGEENIPPKYGSIFLSVIFPDNTPDDIINVLEADIMNSLNDNLGIVSISVQFAPPIVTYLEFNVNYGLSRASTSVISPDFEQIVKNRIIKYVDDELKTFKKPFRKSNLTTLIDNISPSIVYSNVSVKLQRTLVPVNQASASSHSTPKNYQIQYPVPLQAPNRDATITSTVFQYSNTSARLTNRANTNIIDIVDLDGNVIRDSVGTYTTNPAQVNLIGFDPGAINSPDTIPNRETSVVNGETVVNIVQRPFIKITAVPANDNIITPTRNHYLNIDSHADVLKASAIVE